MTAGAGTAAGVPRLGDPAVGILESLYQHRLLATRQVHALHIPHAGLRFAQRILARLRAAGLAASVRLPGGMGVWYLTEQGVDAVETVPNRVETRRKPIPREHAVGPLQTHTLEVNDLGIAFVRAAHGRGDECGPTAWRHEIAHPLGPPPGRRRPEQLIADAVLNYQLVGHDRPTSFHYRFVELDRANRAVDDLASKLARYARLYRHSAPSGAGEPLWSHRYPVFPTVLVVLSGRPPTALERRRRLLLALCRQEPALKDTPEVEISVCLLDDLRARGPFAAIFRTVVDPDHERDWLGQRPWEGEEPAR